MRMGVEAVRRAVARDGKGRGLRWGVVGWWGEGRGVREVAVRRRGVEEGGSNDGGGGGGRVWKRWVVSLEDEAEAKRFAAFWHRRDIAPLLGVGDGEEVVVNAEVIS